MIAYEEQVQAKLPDLIIVDGNPLDVLHDLESLQYVVKDGELIFSPQQDGQWKTVRARNFGSIVIHQGKKGQKNGSTISTTTSTTNVSGIPTLV